MKMRPAATIMIIKTNLPLVESQINYGISGILPCKKPYNTVGRPVIPFRKVFEGIFYVLRTGCQWKMLPKEYGSGSTYHRRFQQWVQIDIFKNIWIRLLEEYDHKKGIKWMWQSIDGISIKSPLVGR